MTTHSFNALPVVQGGHTFFVCAISAKTLYSLVRVNERVEDKDEGYQRAFSLPRARAIGRYLESGGTLPGSILVALDYATYDRTNSKLIIENRPDAGWVIDGQHRLQGAARHTELNPDLTVVVYVKLTLAAQIELFVTVNKEQKGVPSSLYYDLLKKLPHKKSEAQTLQERAADLASLLRSDPSSPFKSRLVVTTSPQREQISLTNFVRRTTPLLKPGAKLHPYTDEQRAAMLNNYFRAFLQTYPENASDIFRTVGFGALMSVFPDIAEIVARMAGPNTFTRTNVVEVLEKIPPLPFKTWRSGSGTAAENAAARDVRDLIESTDFFFADLKLDEEE